MKKTLIMSTIAIAITSQTFAIEKNIDFYQNKSIISYSGNIENFNNVKFEGNNLYIDNIKKDSFIRLNDKTGYHYSYQITNSIYDVLNNNVGKNIKYKELNDFKIFRVENSNIILEKNNTLKYVKELEELEIPLSWLNLTNGYDIKFKEKIKNEDKLFYSYEEDSLSSVNKYEIIIKDKEKLSLTHFIEIENNGKLQDNVNVSFFQGEINIKTRQPNIEMMKSYVVNSSMDTVNNFNEKSLSGIKVVELKNIKIKEGFNKFKYNEKDFKYEEIVKLNDNIFSEKIHRTINKNNYIKNLNFKNYINFDLKTDILPSGEVAIYNSNKLIVSDSINHSEKETVSILKNTNKDIKINNVKLIEINKDFNKIESIELINHSKEIYKLEIKDKIYILEPEKVIKIENLN